MYRCDACGTVSEPGEPAHRRVLVTEACVHPARRYRLRGDRKDRVDDGGDGTRIVEEQTWCARCVGTQQVDLLRFSE